MVGCFGPVGPGLGFSGTWRILGVLDGMEIRRLYYLPCLLGNGQGLREECLLFNLNLDEKNGHGGLETLFYQVLNA